ncbi:hypothetical protein ON010_g12963 [Phytophthora cinnamomi]|nr:hypothetical protein ON010_g12963 [Phytophthora cinnamomi]
MNILRVRPDLQDQLETALDYAAYAIRASYHTVLRASPAQLLFGEDMLTRQVHFANWNYLSKQRFIAILQDNERENLKRMQHFYRVGDNVMLRVPARERKKTDPVSKGPFVVKAVHDNDTVMLDTGATDSDDGVDGRVMFYLLVCDDPATEAIVAITALYTAPIVYTTGKPAKTVIIEVTWNGTHPDMHGATANRTLDYYCKSFPFENQILSISLTKLNFYIDACERLGANQSILRSCLEYPPPAADEMFLATGKKAPCFYCPENYPKRSEAENERWSRECVMSPRMQGKIKGAVSMNLCNASGKCFRQPNSDRSSFYFANIIMWSVLVFAWMGHMACAPPYTVQDLHRKMTLVPVVQVIYSSVAYVANQIAGVYVNWQRSILPTVAMAVQVLALVITLETLFWIRAVVVTMVVIFIAVKELQVENIALGIAVGLLWIGINIITYYWTAKIFSMCREYKRRTARPQQVQAPKRATQREIQLTILEVRIPEAKYPRSYQADKVKAQQHASR